MQARSDFDHFSTLLVWVLKTLRRLGP
jgi:hypothetical protein